MTLSRILAATLVAGAVATPAMAGDAVLNSYAHTGSKGKSQVTLYGQVNVAAVISLVDPSKFAEEMRHASEFQMRKFFLPWY